MEDKNKRNAGIINKNARHINHGMFDWSQDEVDEFYNNNMERIAKDLKPRRNCKKYIMDKLLQDGHKLFLISHRAYPHYQNPEQTTLDWLKKNNINYTKLILSEAPDKTKECREYNKLEKSIWGDNKICEKVIGFMLSITLLLPICSFGL